VIDPPRLGAPRLHLRVTDSTNERAISLARAGAPYGTLVTASEQTAGRGRQGRRWTAPAGRALLATVIVRQPPALLALLAAVAVAEAVDEAIGASRSAPTGDPQPQPAEIKWPNDVLLRARKVAGILVEGRPQEGWAVVGIGCNVAMREQDFPEELRSQAGTLALEPEAIETVLDRVLRALERQLSAPTEDVLSAWRARDALVGKDIAWDGGRGRAAGIDGTGRLVVELPEGGSGGAAGGRMTLQAGEVHLIPAR
jgi:BirA family biotin operon repressor/biotin-[acetyl-CoA-carboxylase] ligase